MVLLSLRTLGAGASLAAISLTIAMPEAAYAQASTQAPEEQTNDAEANPTAGEVAAPTDSADEATASDDAEIVVTGSRIARPETDFANPITSITAAQIAQSGETNLTDFLVDSPALVGSTTTADTSGTGAGFNGAGLNLLNLRNLGTQRTLTLVDGRRHVAAFAGTASVDTNSIPTDLVERVDILTGGTSAIYGADGVSGVVNFILKRDFDGVAARGQVGISERGDAGRRFGSITVGKNFADDRANVAIAYQYSEGDNLRFSDRRQGRPLTSFSLVRDPTDFPDNPAVFDRVLTNDLRYADSSRGGAIDIDFDGIPEFTGEGTVYNRGRLLRSSGGLTQGGDSTPVADYSGDIILNSKQNIVNGLASFRASPALRVFAEAKYVSTKVDTIGQPSFDFFTFIAPDNAFIPANIAAVAPDGVLVSRDNFDFGIRGITSDRETMRGVIGIDGQISSNLRYELAYTYGESKVRGQGDNSRVRDRYFAAIDAVRDPATGAIVCRSNLDPSAAEGATTFTPGRNSGCAPLNLFGEFSPSQAALDFVLVDAVQKSKLTQSVASGYLVANTGGFIDLPGGPIQAVVGAEYRKEKSRSRPDNFLSEGLLEDTSQVAAQSGEFDVKEAFAEINVPLLKDLPFAQTLTVSGAVRFSDYSSIGNTFAYQGSGVFAPVRDISFRGTYSQSVRAPNIGELFGTQTGSFEFIDDPCDPTNIGEGTSFRVANCASVLGAFGINPANFSPTTDPEASATILGRSGGNPDLQEETARTWTAGVVLRPSFLRGFTASLDWYNIRLKDAINEAAAQEIVDLCVDQPSLDNVFCNSISRDPQTGFVNDFLTGPQNVAVFRTSGADLVLNYRFQPSNFGTFNLRLTGGYLDKLEFFATVGAEVDDERGDAFAPKYSGTADVTWTKGPVTLNYGLAWQDKTRRFSEDQKRANPDISDPRFFFFKERWEHDFYASIAASERFSFFGGVNNFTDEKPAVASANYPVSAIGRYFFFGARVALGNLF